ncbi:MAG: nucleotidyltransferase domain-containing protein [Thermoanaerobaculia bacterium]
METEALIDRLREAVADGPPGLVSVYLFGSRAEGREHWESDVDVGILLDRARYPASAERFEARLELLRCLAGLVPGAETDVVVLNDAPPGLARRIVLDGRRVWCSDEEADHGFRRDAQLRAADLEPFLRRARLRKLAALAR